MNENLNNYKVCGDAQRQIMMVGNGMDPNNIRRGITYSCRVQDAGSQIPEIRDAVPNWNGNLGYLGAY